MWQLFKIVSNCGCYNYRHILLSLIYIMSMWNFHTMLDTYFHSRVLSKKWLTAWEWIVRWWSLCQYKLSTRITMKPYSWNKFQGWILHQITLFSNIIGSDSTLERNLWFGRLNEKTRREKIFTKGLQSELFVSVTKLICSWLSSLQMIGSIVRNVIFSLK